MKHNLSCILEEPTSMVSVNMLTHKVFLLSEYVQYWIVSTWIYTEEEKLISKINKIYILHTTMLARTQRTYKTYTLVSLLSWIYQRNLSRTHFFLVPNSLDALWSLTFSYWSRSVSCFPKSENELMVLGLRIQYQVLSFSININCNAWHIPHHYRYKDPSTP